jgi:hypothetical protein
MFCFYETLIIMQGDGEIYSGDFEGGIEITTMGENNGQGGDSDAGNKMQCYRMCL